MLNDLLLLSGNDIPFIEAQLTIHHPTIKEIAYLGEENFFSGVQLLNFSKKLLSEEDKSHLEEQTNFDIFIAILRERNAVMQKNRNCVIMVLALLFPQYIIDIEKDAIKLTNVNNNDDIHYINNDNFNIFQEIIQEMFNLKSQANENEFDPVGEMSKRIADKLRKRHDKLTELKKEDNKKIDVISRQASILAMACQLDLNTVMNLTMYQLFDQIERYQLKSSYDIYLKAKLAGAKDLKDPEDWMQDIHCSEYLNKDKN